MLRPAQTSLHAVAEAMLVLVLVAVTGVGGGDGWRAEAAAMRRGLATVAHATTTAPGDSVNGGNGDGRDGPANAVEVQCQLQL